MGVNYYAQDFFLRNIPTLISFFPPGLTFVFTFILNHQGGLYITNGMNLVDYWMGAELVSLIGPNIGLIFVRVGVRWQGFNSW